MKKENGDTMLKTYRVKMTYMFTGSLWRYRTEITYEKHVSRTIRVRKTVLLTNMILDIYKGCFSRTYIWSPSIEVDNTWKPVKDYTRDHIKPSDREKCYFDSYEPSELE